ncbi:hypothetical protein ACH43Y_14080 [Streptomyces rubiginosohelvolus]|uniref:hypothetical protein n=1 Tax=Streptomyces TaxID=1883 RepID=UPI000B5C239B|nr:hypothetical protein [Streptomyces sp. SS07]
MKPRLTHEEHVALGLRLAAIRDELVHLSVQLGNAYPRQGPEAVPEKKLEIAYRALDQARSELENALFREHPNVAETNVYYPSQEDREAHRQQ